MPDKLLNAFRPNPIKSFDEDAYGPGLQDVSVPDALTAYGVGKGALAGADLLSEALAPAGVLRNNAGAIFPEGMAMPKDRNLIKEFGDILPESRKKYLMNQQLSDWHASNMDWPNVLRDKWAMLTHAGGN